MSEITLLVLADPAEPTMQLLKALGPDVRIKISNTADGFSPEIEDARVLFSWGGSKPEVLKVLATAPKLEWIHTRSAGLDGLLAPELIQSPVLLTNGSGSFSQSLGEFVMTGALYFAKDLPRMLRSKATHHWDVFDVAEISKQTMGIVGHGDIGRAIAWRTKAMGMRVLALRRDISPRAGDENVDRLYSNEQLHEMLPECDYVTVSAPLTAYTRHLLSTPEFNVMKSTAVVMNVGRGPVIHEAALVEALRSGRIRGAALDVFEVEPLPADSPLWDMENVLISAHTADHTKDWLADGANFFLEQFGRWAKGEALKNIVDKQAGY